MSKYRTEVLYYNFVINVIGITFSGNKSYYPILKTLSQNKINYSQFQVRGDGLNMTELLMNQ